MGAVAAPRELDEPGGRPAFGRWLAAVAALAAAGRVGWVLWHRGDPPSSDGWAYSTIGAEVARGSGFVNPLSGAPTALHPPGWSLLLAAASWVGVDDLTGHQVVAAVLGTATVVLVGLVGREVAGSRAGLVAAGVAALHPNLWVWERELAAAPATLALLAGLLLVSFRFASRPRPALAVAAGALAGALVLVRSEYALLLVVLIVPLVLLRPWAPVGRRLVVTALAGTAALAVVAPWVAYNHDRFAEPVYLTTGAGITLRYANSPATYEGDLLGYGDPAAWEVVGPGDESQTDAHQRQVAIDHIEEEPERLPLVVLAREGRTWGLYSPMQQADLDRAWGGSPTWVYLAGMAVTWLTLPFAVVGVRRLRRDGTTLLPFAALLAVSVANVALTYGQSRYRVPADLALVVLAGAGIDALLARRRQGHPAPGRTPEADDLVVAAGDEGSASSPSAAVR